MLPNEQHPQQGADVSRPLFHTRSTSRSTPVPQAVPQAVPPSTDHVQRLMGIYEEIMSGPGKHINPDEEIQWYFDHLSADDLVMIGHVFLALAQWKPSYGSETPGVTRGNQDGAGDSAAELPDCNQVSEFPTAPKMPYLAPIGRV